MKKINLIYLYLSILIGGIFFIESSLFSKDTDDTENYNYLEGRYKISKIKKVKDSFKIVFIKDNDNKLLPKRVEIVPQYIHHVLEEGMSLDISFRVEKDMIDRNKKPIELDQVLVYLPNEVGGNIPVWIVSKNKEFMGLNGSRFLKMHSPSSDFSIF